MTRPRWWRMAAMWVAAAAVAAGAESAPRRAAPGGAQAAAGVGPAATARPQPSPPAGSETTALHREPQTLREFLTAPPFEFSRVKSGVTRRDPFQIPLTRIEVVKDTEGRAVNAARYSELARLETERLKTVQASCQALQTAVARNDRVQVLALYQAIEQALRAECVVKANQAEHARLNAQFETLKPQISQVLLAAALASAQGKVDEVKSAFDREQYEDVARLAGEFGKLSAIAETKESPAWKALEAQVTALSHRAKARLEFKNRAIRVTSLIITRRGGVAVINGASCPEGSRLDADTLVAKVEANRIVFVYKGEEIEHRLGL